MRSPFSISILLMILLSATGSHAEGRTELYQRIDPNVVCIHSVMADGTTLRGSGFFISPELLATVSHQVRGASKITVHLQDGHSGPVRVLAQHRDWDVAVLQAPATRVDGLRLAAGPPGLGEEVFTIGCPMGLDHSLSRGVVSNARRHLEGKVLIQTDLTVNNGNSGGPLLNNAGAVVGVIMGSWTEGAGVNFAVPAERLNTLLQKAGIDPNPVGRQLRDIAAIDDPRARLPEYRRLLEEHPDESEIHLQLGTTLRDLGDHEKARNALIRSIIINPESAIAYWNLGMVYATGLHNAISARQAFQRYLQLAPDGDEASRARAWLEANENE